MTEQQFNVIATLLRSRGKVRDAAKAVLVDGLKPVQAVEKLDVSAQSVSNTLARFKKAHAAIEAVYSPTLPKG